MPTSSGVRACRTPLVTSSEVSSATVSKSSVRCHCSKGVGDEPTGFACGDWVRVQDAHCLAAGHAGCSARAGAARAGRRGARLALVARRCAGWGTAWAAAVTDDRASARRAAMPAAAPAARQTSAVGQRRTLRCLPCSASSAAAARSLASARAGAEFSRAVSTAAVTVGTTSSQPRAGGVDGGAEPVRGRLHRGQRRRARASSTYGATRALAWSTYGATTSRAADRCGASVVAGRIPRVGQPVLADSDVRCAAAEHGGPPDAVRVS